MYEDNYEIVSKLISNGYLVHGTNRNFSNFVPEQIRGGFRAREGYGFYFGDLPYKPCEYGGTFYYIKKEDFNFLPLTTDVTINSDLFNEIFSIKNKLEHEKYQLEHELDNVRNNREYDRINGELETLRNRIFDYGKKYDSLLDAIKQTIQQYNVKTVGELQYQIPSNFIKPLSKLFIELGYDGYYYDHVYTVFNFDKLNNLVKKYEGEKVMSENVSNKILFEDIKDDLLCEEYNITNKETYLGKEVSFDNDPESVSFYVNDKKKRLNFAQRGNRAFVILNVDGNYVPYIGKDKYDYHCNIIDRLSYKYGSKFLFKTIVSFGRFWKCGKHNGFPEDIYFFSFWENRSVGGGRSHVDMSKDFLIKMTNVIKGKLGITDEVPTYIACGREMFFEINHDNTGEVNIDKNSSVYLSNLHNLTAKEKHDAMQLFRDEINKKLGKKLAMHNKYGEYSGEMPMAQWRALRYVDENTILNEGSWGYKPNEGDDYWDMTHEVFEPSIKRVIRGLKDDNHNAYCFMGLANDLLKNKNLMIELKDDIYEMIQLFNKQYDKIMNDKEYINSWKEPNKLIKELKKLKKDFDKNSKNIVDSVKKNGLIRESTNKKYVNMNVDLRKGGRNAVKMTTDEFQNEMEHVYHNYCIDTNKSDSYLCNKSRVFGHFVHNCCYNNKENEKISYLKDLYNDIWGGKYKFDSENVECSGGVKMLSKGVPYIECYAGGDWECPVCFFIYFDGTKFRGYVPLKGNAICRENNEAFGNNYDDGENSPEIKFLEKEFGVKTMEELPVQPSNIDYNIDACLEDFLSRLDVKGTYKKRDFTKDDEKYEQYKKEKEEEKKRKELETSNEINESKVIKNDKGEIVPNTCPKCGSKVGLYIKGEPVYLCSNKKCNEYFGTAPCSINENKNRKNVYLTESQLNKIKQEYFIDTNKVLMVKKFLDNMFVRAKMPVIGADGMPQTRCIVGMKGTDGKVIKNMYPKQLFYLIQDKFKSIYGDKEKRDRFLKQVLIDWYNKKITNNGLLSVNKY